MRGTVVSRTTWGFTDGSSSFKNSIGPAAREKKNIYLSVKGFSWTGWGVVAKVDRHSRDGQKYKGSIKQRRQTKELPPSPSYPRPKRISIRIFIDGHPFDFLSLSLYEWLSIRRRELYMCTRTKAHWLGLYIYSRRCCGGTGGWRETMAFFGRQRILCQFVQ